MHGIQKEVEKKERRNYQIFLFLDLFLFSLKKFVTASYSMHGIQKEVEKKKEETIKY